jgi:hypothetical protein
MNDARRKEVADVWLGFAALVGLFGTAAAHTAIALTGVPRWVGVAGIGLLVPLAVWFAWLAYAALHRKWPYPPKPLPPPPQAFMLK